MRTIRLKIGAITGALVLLLAGNASAVALDNHSIIGLAAEPATTTLVPDAVRLRACRAREDVITGIMAQAANNGQRRLDLFSTIAERVETFYQSKGRTLNGYDKLVADVKAKQAAAQSAVNALKSDSSKFYCASARDDINTFKDALKVEISAQQAYRLSVRDLIVGVKSVVGANNSAANTANKGGNQ